MREAGVEPDAVSYTALIDASGKAGDLRRATELLKEMRSAGALPDQVRTVVARVGNCRRAHGS